MVTAVNAKHKMSYGGAEVQVYHANKGEGIPTHAHAYSHATICMAGSCKYTQNGKSIVADKNTQPVELVAGGLHEIETLEDGTVFVNIFAEGKY
jgi:quercetin dioxygenase-like cupin family protein